VSALKNLWPFRRKAPRLVVEFRQDEEKHGVTFSFSALGTDKATDYEKRMMCVLLMALERGADELWKNDGCKSDGMLGISIHARLLMSIVTGETEKWRREMEEARK